MVIEKETVRYFPEDQENLANCSGAIPIGAWAALCTYNNLFTIHKPSLFVFDGSLNLQAAAEGAVRVRLDVGGVTYYVGSASGTAVGALDLDFHGVAYIPAGTYTVIIEAAECVAGASLTFLRMGITNFSDLNGITLARSVGVAVPNAPTVIATLNVVGYARQCVIGAINRHVIRIQAFAKDSDAGGPLRGSIQAPPVVNNFIMWFRINGVDISPQEEYEDPAGVNCRRANYAEHWLGAPITHCRA